MNKDIATNVGIIPTLTIQPYGAEIFTDFERGKHFTVLFFRHDGTARARVLTWIGNVLDDLLTAGVHVSDACEIQLTADQARSEPVTAKTKYRCHLKVPVRLNSEMETDNQAFVDAIRAHIRSKSTS